MSVKKETWQERLDRIDATLDKVASDLGTVSYHNGIMAENFFNEATQKGVNIGGVEFYQYSTNFVIELEKRKRGKINRQRLAEFDIVMLSNDLKKVLLIEVKYRLDSEDKHFFEKRIPLLQKHGNKTLKGKKIYTAFASLAFKKGIVEEFQNAGHYVLTGNNNRVNVFPPA